MHCILKLKMHMLSVNGLFYYAASSQNFVLDKTYLDLRQFSISHSHFHPNLLISQSKFSGPRKFTLR